MTNRVEASRRHGAFDLRWAARRQASDRPRPAAPGHEHVPDGLAWAAFSARCFPGRGRHDFEAIGAYEVYRQIQASPGEAIRSVPAAQSLQLVGRH